MYWFLNYLPLVIDCAMEIYSIFQKFRGYEYAYTGTGDVVILFLWILILSPIYLLCVNFHYINKKYITYEKSIICMASVIISYVVSSIISHKIKWGTFIGDVPVEIYGWMIAVPLSIVLIGMGIFCLVKRKKG